MRKQSISISFAYDSPLHSDVMVKGKLYTKWFDLFLVITFL